MATASGTTNDTTELEYDSSMRMYEDMLKRKPPTATIYNWVDITKEFNDAVKELELGELLHDRLFGLFEAMSAIEMMDPKMDAGMCNRDYKSTKTFDQLVESGALKMDNLTPSECIGIIDSTLACLVSWLEGHSLAQTVFTNLYLHRPYQVQDRVMRAFSISFHKLIDIIKDFINGALVFEEEDFQPMTYGYKLKPDVAETRAVGMLKEVEDDIQKKMRSKSSESSQSEKQEELTALYARIKFFRLFYQVLLSLNKKESVNGRESQKLLSSCLDALGIMHKTVDKGIQPQEDKDHLQMLGFDPLINQRLLLPSFPRYTKVKSRIDALDYIEGLIYRLKLVCRITMFSSFHSALDFFIEFSRHGPCILSRSILQILYLPPCNVYSTQYNRVFGSDLSADVLREAAKGFIAPPSLMPKSSLLSNPQAKEYVDTFLSHCTRPFGNLLQLCGHNRARQRDKLAHLLEDFAALQDEAERVDAYLHNLSLKSDSPRSHLACFGTWVLYHTLRIMIMYLLSGLELELYSIHEYHYIFWYLYEFLYAWLVSALLRANNILLEQDLLPDSNSKNRGSKKNKPKKKKAQPFGKEITLNQALQSMCGGYYKAMVAFKLDSKIASVHPEFDNEQVRYEHRFAPFTNLITPPPVRYLEFKEMNSFRPDMVPDSSNLYLGGCKHFHQARSLMESLANPDNEVTELIRICKTNFVVLKLLATGHKKDSHTPPEFDFSSHQHFPIIKLT
ncbi:hypothetical protein RUM44_005709 [Polyplax serrata]|uniref:Protein MAK10 homolog n=1 Tax=Polyplax serrata TaxID=468196 RepID=A0ABR1AWE3_POLSC